MAFSRPSFSRKVLSWITVAGFTAGGVALTATPAWSAEPQACTLSANAPYQSSSFVYGVANRSGCTGTVQLQAWLFADLPLWPDPQIGYGSGSRVNGSVTGSGPCSRENRAEYYNQARTDTGQSSPESQRRLLC